MTENVRLLPTGFRIQRARDAMEVEKPAPTRLNFGGGGGDAAMGEAEGKAAVGREVLKAVENVDLNLTRALQSFEPDGKVDTDLNAAREDFGKVKFTYKELSCKHDFIRSLVEGVDKALENQDEAEEKMVEGKQRLKKTKERCEALRAEVGDKLATACHKYELLHKEAEDFAAFVGSGKYTDESTAKEQLADIQGQIAEQQDVLNKQEQSIRSLNQQRQDLNMSMRGLEHEVLEKQERVKALNSVDDIEDRRAAAWFENANAVLSSLVGVSNVEVANSEVNIDFEVLPYSRKDTISSVLAARTYRLTLEFQHSDERLTGGLLVPAEVDISDLVHTFVAEKGGTKGAAPLVMEVKARLACRMAMQQELDRLKSRFNLSVVEENGGVMLEFSPAVGKNQGRWRCEVTIDHDYPREHVTPELSSLRIGAFQSPGNKRERALMDSVGRAGHGTVTEMLEDVARRLNSN